MNVHTYIDIPNWNEDQESLLSFITTSIITNTKDFFTYFAPNQLLPYARNFSGWLEKNNLSVLWMAITKAPIRGIIPIHKHLVDNDAPNRCVLLLPIYSCEGSKTIIYDIPDTEYALASSLDKEHPEHQWYEIVSDGPHKVIKEFELSKPSIFDTSYPHGIFSNLTLNSHRHSLVVSVKESLVHFL